MSGSNGNGDAPHGPRRSWLRLDANYYNDPRVASLNAHAELLYVRGLGYAKANDTHGLIPRAVLPIIARGLDRPMRQACRLTAVSLWLECSEGWCIPPSTWDRWQAEKRTPEQVPRLPSRARARADDRARGDKTRQDKTNTNPLDPPSKGDRSRRSKP